MITQEQLIDYLKTARVGEINELISALEDELGVQAPAVSFSPSKEAVTDEPAVEQEFFRVVITAFEKKVDIIRAVRSVTGLGLRDSKERVEALPYTIKEDISKGDAEELAEQLKAATGTVEIK